MSHPPVRWIALSAALSALALPAAAQQGALAGTLYDSLAGAPLAGARVRVAGSDRAATTDAAGAFRIADLPAGEYGVVFEHPRLEQIGWMPDTLRARVAAGGDTPLALAIPSLVRLGVLGCREEAEPGTSVAVGRVADAGSGAPIPGARVAFSWAGMAPRLEGAATARVRTEAVADADGHWYACDLPQGVQVVARVDMPGYARRDEAFLFQRPSVIHTTFLLERGGRGETAFLTGRVLSQRDGSPLQGAIVAVEGTGLSAMSDELGFWELGNVPPGDRTLRVRHAGAERMLPVEVAEAGVADMEIRLPPDAYTLAPITVTATRDLGLLHGFYERRQRAGVGQFVTRSDIQRRSTTHVMDLLRGMRRGRELCGPAVYVDAVLVYDPEGLVAARTGLTAMDAVAYLNVSDVEGVEYYSAGLSVPPEFLRGKGQCAVMVVWTRRGNATRDGTGA
ncbi:carboxypeptidase regulatory-like domain-containing protein [Longimicrobium sp.]|uniref:carboxypeptidase regulatory-like domain-containing protein n=1 Tax=Longimicrobium sp. TaxID=2029185 RepID=UPI002E3066FA|nr:carboxypeptidase regulatory-like domain-containing protein [Longimicrobium sp.]HEX6039661.1 carboxypeptidase regulatory-like domain-containing protein [Longimicrobium sp.]